MLTFREQPGFFNVRYVNSSVALIVFLGSSQPRPRAVPLRVNILPDGVSHPQQVFGVLAFSSTFICYSQVSQLLHCNQVNQLLYYNQVNQLLYYDQVNQLIYYNQVNQLLYYNQVNQLLYYEQVNHVPKGFVASECEFLTDGDKNIGTPFADREKKKHTHTHTRTQHSYRCCPPFTKNAHKLTTVANVLLRE